MEFFNLHTHKYTQLNNVLELVNQYPKDFDESIPYYSIGIHPWYIDEQGLDNDLAIIERKSKENNCLAICECGLDKRIEMPFDLQQLVFEKQLLLAQKYCKPVVIHCVAAFEEVIAIKKRLNITVPLIIHGFSKSEQLAKQLVDNGFYLSFGKYLLRNPELESVFTAVPEDRFFLETDTIDENIEQVYELAAKYSNCTLGNIQEKIKTNFQAVFKISLESK